MRKKKLLLKLGYVLFSMFCIALLVYFVLWFSHRKYIENAQENEYKILKDIENPNFELKDVNPNNHIYIHSSEVSPYLVNGYVAIEDKSFYKHNGVDLKAIARAMVKIVTSGGKVLEGGSTITQQVIKNNILTQEKTIDRKLKEFFIALDFEKNFSKEEIMTLYLNTCYYGNGCYGVEKASWYYFGKSAKDLTISECAILIGTSNSPNNYNPFDNTSLCKEKRDGVLEKMFTNGVINKEEYDIALKETIKGR